MNEDDYEILPTQKIWVHLSAGCIAGITEHCVMFPFDSVKTRLQSLCPCPEVKCPTAIHGLYSIVKNEGWKRPLRGVNAMATGAAPAHALYFTIYEKSKYYLTNEKNGILNTVGYGLSGIMATIVHDAVMNPAEVVKQRMQMRYSPYGRCLECARCIYRVEGPSAFYRSYFTQLTMNIPYQTFHFITYEFMQNLLNKQRKYSPISHLISGGVAGGLAAAITTPLDCIKTVLNTQQNPQLEKENCSVLFTSRPASYRGMADGIRTIYLLRGPLGFFRGIQARVMFQMPATALSWSVYELFKFILGTNSNKNQ